MLDKDTAAILDRLATETNPETGKSTGRSAVVRKLLLSGDNLPVDDVPGTKRTTKLERECGKLRKEIEKIKDELIEANDPRQKAIRARLEVECADLKAKVRELDGR